MRFPALITLASMLVLPSTAGAEVYSWKDASGKTVYSDKPPIERKPTAREIPLRGAPATGESSKPAEGAAESAKSAAPAGNGAKPPEKTREQVEAEADARRNLCDNARKRLIQLESATGVIVAKNEQGMDVPLVGESRRAETEAARKEVDHWCK